MKKVRRRFQVDMNPVVSVIVPVFNVAPYLREALDSLINQSYRNLEILIIDDGSTDGSGTICDEYQDKDSRIIVFHQGNRGLSAARNVGLDNITGDIVAFLDPDDVMYPNMIEVALKTMREKNVRLVAFGTVWLHNGKPVSSPVESYLDRKETLRSYLTKSGICGAIWTKMFEAALFKNIRFREGHNYADVEVFFRILDKCEKLYAIHEPLFKYRKRQYSITATNSPDNRLDSLDQNLWVTEYARLMNINGDINDVIEKLKAQGVRISLAGYNALYNDQSIQSEKAKQVFKLEVAQKVENVSYSHFIVKIAAKIFLFSPKLFVFLYRTFYVYIEEFVR